jgi:Tfp pilus assembly protein PilV
VEKSVEVSRKEKQVALVLISVLLAMFVLAIVLLSWHDMS